MFGINNRYFPIHSDNDKGHLHTGIFTKGGQKFLFLPQNL